MTTYTGSPTMTSDASPDILTPTVDYSGNFVLTTTVGFTITNQGPHAHAIDVPDYVGTSGAVSTPDSGASSAAAASGNLQPYSVLNYIIKI
jgi:hypothetical protein